MVEKFQYFDGKRFTRDEISGYYLCSTKSSDGSRKRMHVYVWEYYNGGVPVGHHIHHVDEDKSNNHIENLKLIKDIEHLSFHAKERAENNYESVIDNLKQNAAPKAKDWHRSCEGHDWHKQHYDMMKDKLHQKKMFHCLMCGKEFETAQIKAKFCSGSCKAKYRRAGGIDNIESECIVCGKRFVKNRYAKTQTCSKECATKLLIYRRNKIHW